MIILRKLYSYFDPYLEERIFVKGKKQDKKLGNSLAASEGLSNKGNNRLEKYKRLAQKLEDGIELNGVDRDWVRTHQAGFESLKRGELPEDVIRYKRAAKVSEARARDVVTKAAKTRKSLANGETLTIQHNAHKGGIKVNISDVTYPMETPKYDNAGTRALKLGNNPANTKVVNLVGGANAGHMSSMEMNDVQKAIVDKIREDQAKLPVNNVSRNTGKKVITEKVVGEVQKPKAVVLEKAPVDTIINNTKANGVVVTEYHPSNSGKPTIEIKPVESIETVNGQRVPESVGNVPAEKPANTRPVKKPGESTSGVGRTKQPPAGTGSGRNVVKKPVVETKPSPWLTRNKKIALATGGALGLAGGGYYLYKKRRDQREDY